MATGRSDPRYLSLYRSGELKHRADLLYARLADCDLCPHLCHVDRPEGKVGFCRTGAVAPVASVCSHHGEEPPLSGTGGSGTVFFGNCNMRCVYCQNFQISQDRLCLRGKEMDAAITARQMISLQDAGCHNINFVSPSHVVPQMVRAVLNAVPLGLRVPIVYNTGGYDSVDVLKSLDGVVDIYLPDIRYASDVVARKYSGVRGYVAANRAAVTEMYRQVGHLVVDESGVAQKGLLVRHLILPGGLAGSEESLRWLAKELSPDVYLSVMAQYYPAHRASRYPELSRRITAREYDEVIEVLADLGMENGWVQELESAENYRPDFGQEKNPFQRDK